MTSILDNIIAWIWVFSPFVAVMFIAFLASIAIWMSVKIANADEKPIAESFVVLTLMAYGLVAVFLTIAFFKATPQLSHYAHQETVKPYQYTISKDNRFYYKMSKNGQTHQGRYDDTKVKISDHTKTIVYGKKWVADKNATKSERQFVNQQDIEWHKVEYRKAAD